MKGITISLALGFVLSGCMVGPDYHPPNLSMPEKFSETPDQTAECSDNESLLRWWKIFDDPFLDKLLEKSISGSFDYRIALEQIAQARAVYWIQFTDLLPEIDNSATSSRSRSSKSFAAAQATSALLGPTSPITNFYQFGFDAIWELDFFGKIRRSVRASANTVQAKAAEARAVKIMILSEVAATYAAICALQEKLQLQTEVLSSHQKLSVLSDYRFQAGLTNTQEIEIANASINLDQAAIEELEILLKQTIYSLGTLLGNTPEELIGLFQEKHPIPKSIQEEISTPKPEALLTLRPDIIQAERQLAAATEQIGVAVADLYPSISLTGSSGSFASNPLQGGNMGFASDRAKDLFQLASRVWGIGAFVEWPVFDFGKRRAGIKEQESLAKQSYLNYQKTVISALEEVESSLVAFYNEKKRFSKLQAAANANLKVSLLTDDLYQSGLKDEGQALEARISYLNSKLSEIDSEQAITTNLIYVYKSFGGVE